LAVQVRTTILGQQEREVRRTASASVADRRGWDRLPISIPFFVRGSKAGGEEFLEFATALNLSAGGLLLATRRYLEPGTQISLEIPVALLNKAQLPRSVSLLHATVLRCTPDRQYFLLGLQFEEPLLNQQTGLETGKSRSSANQQGK
jgi:PilZ domain